MLGRFMGRRKSQQGPSEATRARQRAEAELARTREQTRKAAEETAYYFALAESLRQLREANHLTELFFVNRHRPRGQQ